MPKFRPLAVFVCAVLAISSSYAFGAAIVLAAQQQAVVQAERVARFEVRVDDVARRLGIAEGSLALLLPDVAVMKSDMAEVKWLARGAASAVVLHFIMVAMGVPIRRHRHADDADDGDSLSD